MIFKSCLWSFPMGMRDGRAPPRVGWPGFEATLAGALGRKGKL